MSKSPLIVKALVEGNKEKSKKPVKDKDVIDDSLMRSVGLKVIDSDMLNILYTRARKYYMRLKRNSNGTGLEEPYLQYCEKLGISKKDADVLFYNYLERKYPSLINLIKINVK